MMAREQYVVATAARMVECRRICRTLFQQNYFELMDGYGRTIRHVAEERKIEVITAAMAMAEEMQQRNSDPVLVLCLMAAAVEIVDPSPDTPATLQ